MIFKVLKVSFIYQSADDIQNIQIKFAAFLNAFFITFVNRAELHSKSLSFSFLVSAILSIKERAVLLVETKYTYLILYFITYVSPAKLGFS
jgi:hypothetical protein